MRNNNVQMSLCDTYENVCSAMENNKSEFIKLLEEHIKIEELIGADFYRAFYSWNGRPRNYQLESLIRFCLLQSILPIPQDKTLLTLLKLSRELREYCGFDKVPDGSKITRFKQNFVNYIKQMFDRLVEITEPICREIDAKKADYLIYDPTGIKVNVAENNPKFLNTKINNAKKLAKNNPELNAHSLAYASMPESAKANPLAKQQYINGHFCYAFKAGILANGIGIVRDISFFDEDFKKRHPEVVSQKTDNPEIDKEIGDSTSLKPVLSDFFSTHPNFSYGTFLGDSSFDSYDIYSMLRNDFNFDRMCIPLNHRNASNAHSDYDKNGTPVCPIDKTPFNFHGVCRGKNRSQRIKWICPKSVKKPGSSSRICTCGTPCTDSKYGRCVYTYPDKDLRFYPGIARGTEHWDNLYKHRVLVERTIGLFKDSFGVSDCRTFNISTMKTNLLFAGITQLVGVVIAHAVNKIELYKSVRKLIA